MIAIVRVLLIACYFVFVCVFGLLYSLVRPFHRNNVYVASKMMGWHSKLMGVEVEIRIPESVKDIGPCVYIANHQNSYDLFLISNSVQPGTATVGKKSLIWIPLFGQLYWLTGNILIDRSNRGKALGTISQTVQKIRQKQISVWIFPEGTRSYGRGLLPFKTGAFHTAMQAEVPLVPLCMSSTKDQVKLNRWDNGKVIIELMEPWQVAQSDRPAVRDLADKIHDVMEEKINQLDKELND